MEISEKKSQGDNFFSKIFKMMGKAFGATGSTLSKFTFGLNKKPSEEKRESEDTKSQGLFTGGIFKTSRKKSKSKETGNIKSIETKIQKIYMNIGEKGQSFVSESEAMKDPVIVSMVKEVRALENRIKRLTLDQELTFEKDVEISASVSRKIESTIKKSCNKGVFDSESDKAIFNKVALDILDEEYEIRLLAIAELGRIGNKSAISVLRESLNLKDEKIVSEILNALILLGDKDSLDLYKKYLVSDSVKIRLAALRGIYKFGGEDEIEDIISCLRDSHSEVRKSAVMFLGWKGVQRSSSSILRLLKDDDDKVREQALYSLAAIRDESTVLPLIRSLITNDVDYKKHVLKTINSILGESLDFKLDLTLDQAGKRVNELKKWWFEKIGIDLDKIEEESFKTEEEEEKAEIIEKLEKVVEPEKVEVKEEVKVKEPEKVVVKKEVKAKEPEKVEVKKEVKVKEPEKVVAKEEVKVKEPEKVDVKEEVVAKTESKKEEPEKEETSTKEEKIRLTIDKKEEGSNFTKKELDKTPYSDLMKICKTQGLKFGTTRSKNDLIKLILKNN